MEWSSTVSYQSVAMCYWFFGRLFGLVLLAAASAASLLGGKLDWLPADNPARVAPEGTLCTRSYLSEEEGAAMLDAAVQQFHERVDWEEYFDTARRKMREGAGLYPWPSRTPLHPIIRNGRSYDGYSVWNVAFESVPGYWVTGNLYLPDNLSDPVPAVLHTHGHSGKVTDAGGWERHGRFKPDVQYRAATLARMGAVSLTIDMFGYGDSTVQFGTDAHRHAGALTIQTWNAVRALDFLESLPYVDNRRLAVTGHSGGATQAFLLTALDPRISVSAPVTMVSAHFFGGCPCESGLPIHLSTSHFVSNPMIAAMAAPRPQLLVSVGGDWTLNTPLVEFPFIQEVYADFGALENLENVHLGNEGHNYGFSKRAALYPFLAQHLLLDLEAVLGADRLVDEGKVVIESPMQMRVFHSEEQLPSGALASGDAVLAQLAALKEQSGRLEIAESRVMDLLEASGVHSEQPLFSWKLRSEGVRKEQTAWQIQVGKQADGFHEGAEFLWESGKVAGSQQSGIRYAGVPLTSSSTVWWRARVWDEADRVGPWSEPHRIVTGVLRESDWQAQWITHPDSVLHERKYLGYRSEAADSVDVPKWIEVDLGKSYPLERIVLRAVRHTVAERVGFPMQFRILIADTADFAQAVVVADHMEAPRNKWKSSYSVDFAKTMARYVRIEVPVLRELNGDICLAMSQIEIVSGGQNIAVGAQVRASDSLEDDLWSLDALVDGKGASAANPVANRTFVLERNFELSEVPAEAIAHVAGVGTYFVTINGHRVGERKLSPGWTDYEQRVLYDTFRVESLLREGPNHIEIHLAGGMYSVPSPEGRYTKFVGKYRPLQAIFQLDAGHSKAVTLLKTDASWTARYGAVTYSHVYGGEDYDARLEGVGERVSALVISGPGGALKGADWAADPIRTVAIITPRKVPFAKEGPLVFDLEQNGPIMVRLTADGPAGSKVRIIPAELLAKDKGVDRGSSGGGRAWWEVTLDGEGSVHWESEYFYHGARYLEVQLIPAEAEGELPELLHLEGLVTHASAQFAGRFVSSMESYNQAHELIRWAQRSNMMSVLTDCPHRERLGWLEQYHLNGPSIRYAFDLKRHYRKTFGDMRDAQTEQGLVPNIAPEYIVFEGAFRDSPEWGSALILAAWQQYLFHGDLEVLKDNYAAMVAYLDYLGTQATGNLLRHGLGDWYDLGPERPGFAQLTPPEITASAIYFEDAMTLSDIARLLGKTADAARFEQLAAAIQNAFHAQWYDAEKGAYWPFSQAAQALALATGLCPPDARDRVLQSLEELLEATDYRLTAGDVGHRYLLKALSDARRDSRIHSMHGRADRPGYGFQIRSGATSLTESWDANRHASQNHFMLGHLMEWLYGGLAGIRPDIAVPGFREIIIDPRPVDGVRWVDAEYASDYGNVRVRWKRDTTTATLHLDIPPNTHARVQLPDGSGELHRVGSGRSTFNWEIVE